MGRAPGDRGPFDSRRSRISEAPALSKFRNIEQSRERRDDRLPAHWWPSGQEDRPRDYPWPAQLGGAGQVSAQERGNHAAAPSDSCPWRTRLPRSGRDPEHGARLSPRPSFVMGWSSTGGSDTIGFLSWVETALHSRARSLGSDPGGPRVSVHVV